MHTKSYTILRQIALQIFAFGFDVRSIKSYKNIFKFMNSRRLWKKNGGKITKNFIILTDFDGLAGNAKGHYFHQDLLVANLIATENPRREIDVLDIRPLEIKAHKNINFIVSD